MLNPERPDYPLKRTSYKTGAVINTFAMMDFCARHNDFHIRKDDKDLIRLTKSNIQSYTAKNSESPSHPFFELAEDWYNKASELNSLSAALTSELKFRLLDYMQETLTSYKQKANLHSYDDLISRMRDAVTANYGNSGMTASLNKRYHAALIDEFQDTDPYQYEIFNTAFGRQGKPFFMIGDPKQAIYSFRGADVYAYLKAASGNTEKKTLTSNYRSTPELVTAVNTLFSGEGSFLLDKIEYSPSKGEHKELPLLVKGVRQHAMNFWESDSLPPQETARITAAHIAELLSLSEKGLATLDGKKIRPSDIAVLCRKKDQLTMVKTALSAFRVPAVVSGSESVFSSDEALELCNILTAVLAPFSAVHVKTALITPIFGLKPFETYLLEETDRWDSITEEFKAYNDIIMMRGFAPMFFNMASRTKMYEKIAGTRNGERKLTNYIHLAELAQKYEADKKAAPHDILRWMKEKITSDSIRDDEAELKMDSDENAVTIITIHKSKGLEYNIVYTPFLHMRKTRDIPPYKYHKDDKYLMDIAGDSENADIARYEEMAEDLRVAYVALTRAKAVCYTAWGTATGHDISAVSRLINGRYAKYEPGQLQRFAGTVIGVLPLPCEDIQSYLPDNTAEITPPREFNSSIPDVWRINSFSGLIHQSSGVKDTDQYTKSGVDSSTLADIFTFPKGAKAGTCLHECMESISFENAGFAEVFDITREKLARYSFDPEFAEPVAVNITSILEKDISGMKLCRLKKGEYVHEMEFQMATKHFSSEELTALFEKHSRQDFALAASTLDFNALRGFMNGFADLIFCHNGRYYVLDWKSNHLGGSPDDYSYEKMHSEMLSNHYYLQLYIYTLALHMHLKNTIRGYSYETHIGGGIYIFMRGVASSGENGIYMHRPTAQIIEDMEKMVTRQ
jgi:exodeoxyribonuclease V beta subunit